MTVTEAITKAQINIVAEATQEGYSLEQELKDAETIANLTVLKIIARKMGMD